MNASSILLNGDYTFLCVVGWKRAMCLVFADKVKIVKYSDRIIRGVERGFRAPAVMVLIKVVRSVYRNKVPYSKKNVLIRDRHTCVYCGKNEKGLTIDHVIPRSNGGNTAWENCVACCKRCNHKKGSRTPTKAGMHLTRSPFQPTIGEFIRIRLELSGVSSVLVELGIYR